MGEIRDRGIILATEGRALLKDALSGMRDENGKKLTLLQLSIESGVSEKTVSRLINGSKSVDEGTARAIAQVLKVPFENLEPFIEQPQAESNQIEQLGNNPFEYGKSVSGQGFYGRSRELKFIRDRLLKGISVSLIGLRRIGKTSLLKQVMAQKSDLLGNAEKWVLVSLDLATGVGQSPETVIEGLDLLHIG
jgi:transcriptional regulator with XRE-family HTH domain